MRDDIGKGNNVAERDVFWGGWWRYVCFGKWSREALVAQLVRALASHARGQEFDPPQE